jgi:hypothetical protein
VALRRQLSLPVRRAIEHGGWPNTCGQSANARLVVIRSDVFSESLLIRWNSNRPPAGPLLTFRLLEMKFGVATVLLATFAIIVAVEFPESQVLSAFRRLGASILLVNGAAIVFGAELSKQCQF